MAFVDTVSLVYQTLNADEPTLVRRSHMHKAEMERLHGLNWWSKACRSDRHAALLINSDMKDGKAKRLYVYLGGGSLTSAGTELAQGVVCRCKTWSMAVAVLIAARFLTLCAPGEMISLRKELIAARTQEEGTRRTSGTLRGWGPPAGKTTTPSCKPRRSPSALLGCSARRATARRSRLAMSSGCRRAQL